jgi:hypothetical protein
MYAANATVDELVHNLNVRGLNGWCQRIDARLAAV